MLEILNAVGSFARMLPPELLIFLAGLLSGVSALWYRNRVRAREQEKARESLDKGKQILEEKLVESSVQKLKELDTEFQQQLRKGLSSKDVIRLLSGRRRGDKS